MVLVVGTGSSKKEAKKNAAIAFLNDMEFSNGQKDQISLSIYVTTISNNVSITTKHVYALSLI